MSSDRDHVPFLVPVGVCLDREGQSMLFLRGAQRLSIDGEVYEVGRQRTWNNVRWILSHPSKIRVRTALWMIDGFLEREKERRGDVALGELGVVFQRGQNVNKIKIGQDSITTATFVVVVAAREECHTIK